MTETVSPRSVAVVGFGTVGQAVARILCTGAHPRLRLTHVCNRDVRRKRVDWVPDDVVWTDDYAVVLDSTVDIVTELVGGLDPATDWIRQALQAGKSVVTANKQVIAHHGPELLRVAAEAGRGLYFEAAVAGGIPIIHALREGLTGDSLFRVRGVLNGTCNYILTRMEGDGVSFHTALAEAQTLGLAEADPSTDVDGYDAQAKLAILAAVGLGRPIDVLTIPLRSITGIEAIDFVYARHLGCTIRQVSHVEVLDGEDSRVVAAVHPTLVPRSSALARVEGSRNVVVVEGRFGGETALSGFGAGGAPTGAAVVSDLETIASRGCQPVGPPFGAAPATVVTESVSPHYIRFVVSDRPGIIAALADVFSRHGVNIDAVLQEPGCDKRALPFVVTLDACASTAVDRALLESASFDFHVRPPLWMPMLVTGEDARS